MTGGIPKSVAETCFNEAVTCFEEFLSNQGLPSALWWVFQEDVVFRKDSVFIKTPIPK
jgi:hypothetical protein